MSIELQVCLSPGEGRAGVDGNPAPTFMLQPQSALGILYVAGGPPAGELRQPDTYTGRLQAISLQNFQGAAEGSGRQAHALPTGPTQGPVPTTAGRCLFLPCSQLLDNSCKARENLGIFKLFRFYCKLANCEDRCTFLFRSKKQ